jgi:hypothetical protein
MLLRRIRFASAPITLALLLTLSPVGCSSSAPEEPAGAMEAGAMEGGVIEGGAMEGGAMEGGAMEGGVMESDAGN